MKMVKNDETIPCSNASYIKRVSGAKQEALGRFCPGLVGNGLDCSVNLCIEARLGKFYFLDSLPRL